MPFVFMYSKFGSIFLWVTKESYPAFSVVNRSHGKFVQSAHVSKSLFVAQHVATPQDGCLSLKSLPKQPGQADFPFVWNLGQSPQSIPQQPIVFSFFKIVMFCKCAIVISHLKLIRLFFNQFFFSHYVICEVCLCLSSGE